MRHNFLAARRVSIFTTPTRFLECFSCHLHTRFTAGFSYHSLDFHFYHHNNAHGMFFLSTPYTVRDTIFLSRTVFFIYTVHRFATGFSCRPPDFDFPSPSLGSCQVFPVTSIQGSRLDFLVAHWISIFYHHFDVCDIFFQPPAYNIRKLFFLSTAGFYIFHLPY